MVFRSQARTDLAVRVLDRLAVFAPEQGARGVAHVPLGCRHDDVVARVTRLEQPVGVQLMHEALDAALVAGADRLTRARDEAEPFLFGRGRWVRGEKGQRTAFLAPYFTKLGIRMVLLGNGGKGVVRRSALDRWQLRTVTNSGHRSAGTLDQCADRVEGLVRTHR